MKNPIKNHIKKSTRSRSSANTSGTGNATYLKRAPWAALLIAVLFLVEIVALLHNSSISAAVNPDVAYYKQELEDGKNKQNIIMGDVYDRNHNALVTFTDVLTEDQGTYLEPYAYSQVLGYCRKADSSGLLGRYESLLRFTEKESDTKGCSLTLTLDHELQEQVYQALVDAIGENGRGSMVVMNADTGEILAMVSTPVYDASNASKEMEWMNDPERSNKVWHPLAKDGEDTAPGSTFKLISALLMLENGMADFTTSDDLTYEGNGYTIQNYSTYTSSGTIGLKDALRKSSNVFFIKGLLRLDGLEEQLTQKAKALYLGESLSLDFGNLISRWPFDEKTWSDIEQKEGFQAEYERAAMLFGQSEIRMTSVQGAMLAAGIINGGKIMTPYMVESVQNSSGVTRDLSQLIQKINKSADFAAKSDAADCLKENHKSVTSLAIPEPVSEKGTVLSTLTNKEYADQLLEMMQETSIQQYGFDASLGVAAKSGTSETGQNANAGNNAWMVSAAELNGTRYAICINWAKAAAGTQGKDMRVPTETIYRYLQQSE